MSDRIDTHAAAIEEMLQWANGDFTYRNKMLMATEEEGLTSSDVALCAIADSAEVQKWAAVARALNSSTSMDLQKRVKTLEQALGKLGTATYSAVTMETPAGRLADLRKKVADLQKRLGAYDPGKK